MHADRITIRAGNADDLATVMDIWLANEAGDSPTPIQRPGILPDYPHLLATGQLWIAEQDGVPVGFSGVVQRGSAAFLTDLFVDPHHHSSGIGSQLLSRALDPYSGLARCTVSSGDPRALALYVRYGMRPQWPNFLLRSHRLAPERLPDDTLTIEQAAVGDTEIIAWDAMIGGRHRPEDHAFWAAAEGGVSLWLARSGKRIGYAVVRLSAATIWSSHTARIGPVGAHRPEDAKACLIAAARWAAAHATTLRIDVPGPNGALASLLAAGFRITDIDTFMLDATEPLFDASCYIGSGGALL